jgi:hypothetical protein
VAISYIVSAGITSSVFAEKEVTNFMEPSLDEKPAVAQSFTKCPAFYGTRRFINVFTRARHWALS